MSAIGERLASLGIVLPKPAKPRFSYIPVRQTGNLLYTSGQDCRVDGKLLYTGKLGRELTVEMGRQAARQTMLNLLGVLQEHLGDLDRVEQIVKLLAFVNSAPGFADQPSVVNGASDLLIEVFGEKGRHARSAIGTSELPFDTPVEIEMIVEIRP
jgi:enamine deaminase RidA (YjgF/YER057c/UK114 family)